MTGRLRVEHSHYMNSIKEEELYFEQVSKSSELIEEVAKHIRANGSEYVREIPFAALWNDFWYTNAPHYVVWHSHKVAIVYSYNEETKQFIGSLLDITPKRSQWEFLQKYSIQGRELVLIEEGKKPRVFIKTTNAQCFPIFPGYLQYKHHTHNFNLDGWDYS
mgnify:CR=1 FL=1